MALPSSRNTTYAALSQVKSADLNALQDCIIQGARGDLELLIDVTDGHAASGTWTQNSNHGVTAGGGGDAWTVGIPVRVGDRIRSVTFYYQRLAGTLTFALWGNEMSAPGIAPAIDSDTDNSSSGVTELTISGIDHTVADDTIYYLKFTAGGADILYGAKVVIDRPLV